MKKNWNWRGLNGRIVHRLAISIEDKQVQHVQIDISFQLRPGQRSSALPLQNRFAFIVKYQPVSIR